MTNEQNSPREWFDVYMEYVNASVWKPASEGVLYVCPCCGYPTLSERGTWEICTLCDWEDDGQDDPRADEVWGGPNGAYSLTQARENFKRYQQMYDPDRSSQQSEAEVTAKKAIVAAFDTIKHDTNGDGAELAEIIAENYKILDHELHNQVDA